MSDGTDEFAFLQAWPRERHVNWLTPSLRPTLDRRARGIWPLAEAVGIAAQSGGLIQVVPLLEGLAAVEIARAQAVNSRLVTAFMIHNHIRPSFWPDVDDITPHEAETCCFIVKAAERAAHRKLAPGSARTFTSVIEANHAAKYLAWAILGSMGQREMARRSRLDASAEDRAMLSEAQKMHVDRMLRAGGLIG